MEGDSPFVRLSLNIHYILLLVHSTAQQLHKFYVVSKTVWNWTLSEFISTAGALVVNSLRGIQSVQSPTHRLTRSPNNPTFCTAEAHQLNSFLTFS